MGFSDVTSGAANIMSDCGVTTRGGNDSTGKAEFEGKTGI
jgi:hypothetical protein